MNLIILYLGASHWFHCPLYACWISHFEKKRFKSFTPWAIQLQRFILVSFRLPFAYVRFRYSNIVGSKFWPICIFPSSMFLLFLFVCLLISVFLSVNQKKLILHPWYAHNSTKTKPFSYQLNSSCIYHSHLSFDCIFLTKGCSLQSVLHLLRNKGESPSIKPKKPNITC